MYLFFAPNNGKKENISWNWLILLLIVIYCLNDIIYYLFFKNFLNPCFKVSSCCKALAASKTFKLNKFFNSSTFKKINWQIEMRFSAIIFSSKAILNSFNNLMVSTTAM